MKLLGGTCGHRKGGLLANVDAVDVLLGLHGDDLGEGLICFCRSVFDFVRRGQLPAPHYIA
jgi:hypothetical protein